MPGALFWREEGGVVSGNGSRDGALSATGVPLWSDEDGSFGSGTVMGGVLHASDGLSVLRDGLGVPVLRAETGAGGFVTKWLQLEAVDPVSRSGNGRSAAEEAPSALTLVASVETEDRAGDLIEAAGWELDAYARNPVVLWAHDYLRPPIGRSLRTWVEGRSLLATIEFAPMPFAQEIRALYAGGFMRGVSVGFRALESEPRPARTSADPLRPGSGHGTGRRGVLFRRQELLEISAAPVPLNAMALAVDSPPAGAPGEEQRAEAVGMLGEIGQLWRDLAV